MVAVLAAEDDPDVRDLLVATLSRGGYDVTVARDGREAIDQLDRGVAFDALITDQRMPHADGVAVIGHAQHVDPTLPCVIVTAFHDLELAMEAMQKGAVGFVTKPFRPPHLLAVVERAVERRRLINEVMSLRVLAPMLERFTMVLANTLETKDASTSRHSQRLVALADAVGTELGVDGDERTHLRLGAALHDIGKVAVPNDLLNKTDTLSDDDIECLRRHPTIGAGILADTGIPETVRAIILHHHERYDGRGYPLGLRGAAIPLGARIVGSVDAADVMLFGRPYAPARPLGDVIEVLRRERGNQFDSTVAEVLIDVLTDRADEFTPAAAV